MTAAEVAYKTSAAEVGERNDLVMQELSQVYYIAARIRERLPQQVELEDLVNAGVIGLLEASRSFDSSKNMQFKTFAKFRIRGAILDSLRESDWGSRSLRRRGREIAEATARSKPGSDGIPSKRRSPQEMHLEPEHLHRIIAQLDWLHLAGQQRAVSNDRSESLDVIESAPNLDDPDPIRSCLEGEMKAHLAEAISKLSEREQLILSLYYREELTMKEIAEVVGVALSRVSQIRQATMIKLKASLEHLQERHQQRCHQAEGSLSAPSQIKNPRRNTKQPASRKQTAKPRTVHSCNFSSAGRLSNENARSLTAIHETFARQLTSALDAYLGTGVEVKLEAIDQLPIKEHIADIPPLSYIVPLSSNTMIVECDIDLVFPIIELLLGGAGDASGEHANFRRSKKKSCRT